MDSSKKINENANGRTNRYEESPKNVEQVNHEKVPAVLKKKSSFFRENDDQKLKRFIN